MGGRVKHARIVPENLLGAVAVVDVEIHDRHPFGAMDGTGAAGGDGDIVEEAEAHRRRRLGMMAGRAHGDEGIGDLAGHHLIHRLAGGPHRMHAGFPGARAHRRIAIELHQTIGRRRLFDGTQIGFRVNTQNVGTRAAGRCLADQALKFLRR